MYDDPRLKPVLKNGDLDFIKLGEIEHKHRLGEPLTAAESDARDAALEIRSGGGSSTLGIVLAYAARVYEAHLEQVVREYGGTIVTETTRWETGRDHPARERHVQRFRGTRTVTATTRPCARPRGTGKRPKGRSTRSSAKSGDSGSEDGESEPPHAGRLCQLSGCDRPARRKYCCDAHADLARKRRQRGRDRQQPERAAERAAENGLAGRAKPCRCNGHHILDGTGYHCIKCGHDRRPRATEAFA